MADPRPACPECYLVVRLCYTQTCNHACHGTGQREAPPPCLACGRDTHTTEHHHRVVGRLEALKEAPPASPETPGLIAEFLDDLGCILDVDNEAKVRPLMEKWRGRR